MDWFERLTGFKEATYDKTRAQMEVNGSTLRSKANGKAYGVGTFEMASLADLRARVAAGSGVAGRARVSIVTGDVRKMHQAPEYAGALVQVASQANCLEMVGPDVTPEQGVTRYRFDKTQGPACALACGAATLYRNYLVPVPGRDCEPDQLGQTAARQLDGLADIGAELSARLGKPIDLGMRNGYCLPSRVTLDLIGAHLRDAGTEQTDTLAGKLRIGVHQDLEVTDAPVLPGPLVSQAFCSALPLGYSRVPREHWEPFARLVLTAAYESTLLAGVVNARRAAGSNIVLLTTIGAGAFGNPEAWVHDAIRKAVQSVAGFDLDVRLVSYGTPSPALSKLVTALM